MLPSAFVVPVEFVSIIQTYIAKAIALETECPPAMRQTLSGEQVVIYFEVCSVGTEAGTAPVGATKSASRTALPTSSPFVPVV